MFFSKKPLHEIEDIRELALDAASSFIRPAFRENMPSGDTYIDELPPEFPDGAPYWEVLIKQEEERLAGLESMGPKEAQTEWEEEQALFRKTRQELEEDRRSRTPPLKALLRAIDLWEGPSDLKEYMSEPINQELGRRDRHIETLSDTNPEPPTEWQVRRIRRSRRYLKEMRETLEEKNALAAHWNEWLAAVREACSAPAGGSPE